MKWSRTQDVCVCVKFECNGRGREGGTWSEVVQCSCYRRGKRRNKVKRCRIGGRIRRSGPSEVAANREARDMMKDDPLPSPLFLVRSLHLLHAHTSYPTCTGTLLPLHRLQRSTTTHSMPIACGNGMAVDPPGRPLVYGILSPTQ